MVTRAEDVELLGVGKPSYEASFAAKMGLKIVTPKKYDYIFGIQMNYVRNLTRLPFARRRVYLLTTRLASYLITPNFYNHG